VKKKRRELNSSPGKRFLFFMKSPLTVTVGGLFFFLLFFWTYQCQRKKEQGGEI